MSVEVRVVGVEQLGATWAVAIGSDGRRILFVRTTAHPREVAVGYAAALRQCPVRIALEAIAA